MTSRFIVLDPSLIDYGGHFYSLDLSMVLAARSAGLEPVIFAHQTMVPTLDRRGITIVPWFRRPMWEFVAEAQAAPESFRSLTMEALASIRATSADHAFVPTAGGRDLEDLLAAMQGMAASHSPEWQIMLHYSPGDGPMNLAREAPLAQVMEAMSATGRVRFYSTVRRLPGCTVRSPSHLCIRHTCRWASSIPPAPRASVTPRPLHVVMLGSARPTKGYAAISDLGARSIPRC